MVSLQPTQLRPADLENDKCFKNIDDGADILDKNIGGQPDRPGDKH